MTDTPNLTLPYIFASQAQKHVTHNEAIRALDCLVQLSVESRALTNPPASPVEGSRYVVAAGASDAWAGKSDKIAAFQDGAWAFYAPKDGWIAWVASENILIVYDSGTWSPVSTGGGGGVTDHDMLTGLADDDHQQYLTASRGDARYTPIDPVTLALMQPPTRPTGLRYRARPRCSITRATATRSKSTRTRRRIRHHSYFRTASRAAPKSA
jgi:hypothetical protein